MKKILLSVTALIIVGTSTPLLAQELIWSSEAEAFSATAFAGVKIGESEWALGDSYVENISTTQYVEFNNVVAPKEGTYELKIKYFNKDKNGRYISAWANQQNRNNSVLAPDTTGQWNGGPMVIVTTDTSVDPPVEKRDTLKGTEGSKEVSILVYLRAGTNKLRIGGTPTQTSFASGFCPNLDFFSLYTTDQEIAKPSDIPNCWHWDYTDEGELIAGNELQGIENLIDNNQNSAFTVHSNGQPVYITFKLPHLSLINGCLFYMGEDAMFNPDPIQVQTSVDNENWITQAMKASDNFGQGKVFELATASQHEFVRLVITSETPVTINEFQLLGIPRLNNTGMGIVAPQYPNDLTGQEVATLSGTFSASTPGLTDYKEVAVNAIDGLQNKFTAPGKTVWLKYEFPDEVEVKSYSVAIGASSNMNRNPKTWVLYGGDWDEEYVEIARVDNFVYPKVNYCNMKFNVTNPGKYVYYKLDITSNNGASDYTHMSEWQLWGNTLPPMSSQEMTLDNKNSVATVFASDGRIEIRNVQQNAKFIILDMSGVTLFNGDLKEGNQSIEIPNGFYIINVIAEKKIESHKVIVK